MKRREFVRTCMAGAVLGSSAATRVSASAAEAAEKVGINPNRLAESAREHFVAGKRTCGESILAAGCEALGIKSELVPDIALGLAGVGLQGETCGVLTGSALVLSLAVAKQEKQAEYPTRRMRTLEAVGRVHRAFKNEFGHTDCRSLCGLDLTTPEGREKLKAGVRAEKCAKYAEIAARILGEELNGL